VNYLKLASKLFYPLVILIFISLYGTYVVHDTISYLRIPIVLRKAIHEIEYHKYKSLSIEQQTALNEMVLAKTCDPKAPCGLHYSNISKEMASGFFQQTYEKKFWGYYPKVNVNIILFNYSYLLIYLMLILTFKKYLQKHILNLIYKKYEKHFNS
jgi:hypothetical protein